MKKALFSVLLFGLVFLSTCVSFQNEYEDYWVIEKSRYNKIDLAHQIYMKKHKKIQRWYITQMIVLAKVKE